MDEQTKAEIARLKEYYQNRKTSVDSLEALTGKKIEHHFPVNLWELADSELDQEMGKRLSFLNEDIDCRPNQNVTSHRRFIGPLIVYAKKIIAKILSPYTSTLFVRQNRFNEQLVTFHLATFIRLRRLEDKIRQLDSQAQELKEQQQEIASQSQELSNLKK
jgi:O-antigen chain-terminating methyltransferase